MPLNISVEVQNAMKYGGGIPVIFAEFYRLDVLDEAMCTHTAELTSGSMTYKPTGDMMNIQPITGDSGINKTSLGLTLNGLDNHSIVIALKDDLTKYKVNILLGYLNQATGALIPDPFLVYSGRIDKSTVAMSDNEASIALVLESDRGLLQAGNKLNNAKEELKLLYPTDTFYDGLEKMNDFVLRF